MWPFMCSCEAYLPAIPKMLTRHDMICGGEGQQESGEYTNCKRMMISSLIYRWSVAGQESDTYKNKAREGTDLRSDVESKRVVGCISCDIGMIAVKAVHSCGAAGKT